MCHLFFSFFQQVWEVLVRDFKVNPALSEDYATISKEDQLKGYEMMQLCRQFENACNQAYMQGKIGGVVHLDNGQVSWLVGWNVSPPVSSLLFPPVFSFLYFRFRFCFFGLEGLIWFG